MRTLVVEDEPLIAEAHRAYVDRVAGYACLGAVHDGASALRVLAEQPVDLVLLDMGLPDMSGLDVLRALRARAVPVDVIAVTSARDLEVVRSAVSGGVVQYLLKPFTFGAFRDKLERYAVYRAATLSAVPAAQADIDRALASLRGSEAGALPKGLAPDSLELVVGCLQGADEALSAQDVATLVGMSRVTARRYLEHLA
ncbi:MAG: response regulator, partial [Frankiales bacterium]|nr:response regulator [Frankiales bacterium]